MTRWRVLLAGVVSGLLLLAHFSAPRLPFAEAQDVGPLVRATCTQINAPITGKTFCFEQSTNTLKFWTGAQWVQATATASGVNNVMDFGARGDGITNDTSAIQAAITAAESTPQSGSIVYWPSGTYKISSGLTAAAGKLLRFRGAGAASILRWAGGNNTCILSIAGTGGTPTNYLGVEDLQFHNGNAATGLCGLSLGTVSGTIYNVTVRKNVFNALATGVVTNNLADEIGIYDNWFTGNGVGVRHVTAPGCASSCAGSNHTFIGNHFQNGTDWAIQSDLSAKVTAIGNTIQSNAAGARGIYLDSTTAPTIVGNYFEWQTTPTGTAISINAQTVGGDSLGGGTISDNVFNLNSAGRGLVVANHSGLKIGPNAWRAVGTAITLTNTASRITVDPQSPGSSVTAMLTDDRTDSGNLTSAESRMDALRVRGALTVMGGVVATASAVSALGDQGAGTVNAASAVYLNSIPMLVANSASPNLTNLRGVSASSSLSNNLRGACSFAATNTCQVTFGLAEPDSHYFVITSGLVNVSAKAKTGFLMTATTNNSNVVDFLLVR